MPAVGSPESEPRGENCDDRVEETPRLVDDISEPLVVGVGEISLEGRWFDGIDREDAQQYRMTGERFLVRSNNAAAGFGDSFCGFGCSSCRLLESAFRRAEALRPRFGFARPPPGRCTLDHSRELYSSFRINVLNLQPPSPVHALAPANIAFEMEDLL